MERAEAADVVAAVGDEDHGLGVGVDLLRARERGVVVRPAGVGLHTLVDQPAEHAAVALERFAAQQDRREQLLGEVAELDGAEALAGVALLVEQQLERGHAQAAGVELRHRPGVVDDHAELVDGAAAGSLLLGLARVLPELSIGSTTGGCDPCTSVTAPDCRPYAGSQRDVAPVVAAGIADGGDRAAEPFARRRAGDPEAARANEGEIDLGIRRAAVDDVGGAGVEALQRVGAVRADEQVVAPVAVHVAGRADGHARAVAGTLAVDPQSARAELAQLEDRRIRAAVDDVDAAGPVAGAAPGVRPRRPRGRRGRRRPRRPRRRPRRRRAACRHRRAGCPAGRARTGRRRRLSHGPTRRTRGPRSRCAPVQRRADGDLRAAVAVPVRQRGDRRAGAAALKSSTT